MMTWCYWLKRNILTEQKGVQAHNHCDMYRPEQKRECTVLRLSVLAEKTRKPAAFVYHATLPQAATRQRSSSRTDKPWQFKPDTIIRRVMRRAPMTRFLSDQFPALYPSISQSLRSQGEGKLVGWVVLGMLQKDGNAREEGKNTARWIYIGVYHNCLSQISFICFLACGNCCSLSRHLLRGR